MLEFKIDQGFIIKIIFFKKIKKKDYIKIAIIIHIFPH